MSSAVTLIWRCARHLKISIPGASKLLTLADKTVFRRFDWAGTCAWLIIVKGIAFKVVLVECCAAYVLQITMCENTEKCIDRVSLLAFAVPFVLGGIWFAFVGLAFLDSLPPHIVSIYDRAYVVALAFVDMGTAFGVGAFTLLAFFRQMKNLFIRLRKTKHA
jgi:hypothetical protein